MAQLLIRKLEDDVLVRMKARALALETSVEQLARETLTRAFEDRPAGGNEQRWQMREPHAEPYGRPAPLPVGAARMLRDSGEDADLPPAQILVRNLKGTVVSRLKELAADRGISLEQHVRDVLDKAIGRPRSEVLQSMARIRAQAPVQRTRAADLIREDRSR